MLKKIIFMMVFICVFSNKIASQHASITERIILSGIVVSLEKVTPLEYVFIWIPGTRIGTHSSKDGIFKLAIPANQMEDSLCFSLLSYQTLKVPIHAIYGKMDTIFMAEQFIYLDQIKINAKNMQKKK